MYYYYYYFVLKHFSFYLLFLFEITFDDIGGLDPIIRSLKEMIVLPLVYPELFQHYKIKPPRITYIDCLILIFLTQINLIFS